MPTTKAFVVAQPNYREKTFEFHIEWPESMNQPMTKLQKMYTETMMEHQEIQCDGPCKKMVFCNEVIEFGDCDHNVCKSCLLTHPSPPTYDGTPSCCNPDCLLLRGVMPIYRPVRYYSSASTASYPVAMLVRVLSFILNTKDICRHQFSFEINGDATVYELKKILTKVLPNVKESAIYYTKKENFKRADLIPLPEPLRKSKLGDLSLGEEVITVVIAGIGLAIF